MNMRTIYFRKKSFESDISKNDEFNAKGKPKKYSDDFWKLYLSQNVLILLITIAVFFFFLDVLTTNCDYWFQRWGSVLVGFAAFLDIFSNSPLVRQAGDNIGSWVLEVSAYVHRRSFFTLFAGSLIWGYGDLVIDLLRAAFF